MTAPGQTPPPVRPSAPRRPSEDQAREARNYLGLFTLLVLGLALSSNLVLPWKLVPLVLGVAALVIGIMTLVKLVRLKSRPLLTVTTVLLLGMSAMMTLLMAVMVAAWPLTASWEQCRTGALTLQAQEACDAELSESAGVSMP
ncbi:hypothetical protein BN1051_02867 [Arthrobacter saudimassiliensis]|uniref:Uncharacterized protein n=1 Tax=Arthrobacter saudimassiliensis TaxID=1461584 RepID=A0A078MVP3_9MICC|nr:hypothetical protein BN1051_02867 [Arthrobacter saudimassiliensis]